MRRWNGWGDDSETFELPETALGLLEQMVGKGKPLEDATLEQVAEKVPASRLPDHPLVSDDKESRIRHCRGQSAADWIAVRSGDIEAFPDGIATPKTNAEVRELIHYAKSVGAHLIPYGGGTSVVGHINPNKGDAPVLTVDMGKLNELINLDPHSHLATFGAGVAGPDIEKQLSERGFTLGHYPQSFELSTLGGWVVTRSSGQQSMHYGRIENLFGGGKLESPEGTLEIPTFPASAAGPDLREMVLGSEGRYGILTEVVVRASELPDFEEFHTIFFPDWDRAVAASREIVQARLPLSMLRLSTAVETATTLALAGRKWLITGLESMLSLRGISDQKCMLMLGATGERNICRASLKEALNIANSKRGWHVGRSMGRAWHKKRFHAPYARDALWEMGYAVDTLETAIDWSGVNGLLNGVEEALREGLKDIGEKVHVFTHLSHLYPSGSNIYTSYVFRIGDTYEETYRRWNALKTAASKAIVKNKGTISHQHGVGTDHYDYLEAEKGELGMAAISDLCKRFDPQGTMNPGKLIK